MLIYITLRHSLAPDLRRRRKAMNLGARLLWKGKKSVEKGAFVLLGGCRKTSLLKGHGRSSTKVYLVN